MALQPQSFQSPVTKHDLGVKKNSRSTGNLSDYKITHHAVNLGFLALGQVDDVHPVVVEVLHASLEVLPEEGSRFSGQRNAADTELCETKKIQKKKKYSGC